MGKNSIKPEPETIGRPSKFTPERCADIISAISRRAPYQLAAEANGISERTLFYWLEEGIRDLDNNIESEHAAFLQSIKVVNGLILLPLIKIQRCLHLTGMINYTYMGFLMT